MLNMNFLREGEIKLMIKWFIRNDFIIFKFDLVKWVLKIKVEINGI